MATSRNMLPIIQNDTLGTSVFDVPKQSNGKTGASPPMAIGGFINCKPKGFIPWSAPSPLRNNVLCKSTLH
uniref:Uncharacterized protein n=1 Tax=Cucumis melo TaxID=3656 RepID=A0A9I9E4R8_CUCME